MGIFSRMGDIINSNLNAMIDKAENPEKIARLIIQEMEDTLVEVRTDAARNIAERKELSRKADAYRGKADEWASKAELALDELEAHVEAFDLGSGDSLESQFAQLEADDAIEEELAALKASIGKASKKASK